MVKYLDAEKEIELLFPENSLFNFKGKDFKVVICGKPRPEKGECKTDVYIKGVSTTDDEIIELKISVKLSNADFIENKISYNRVREIFGDKASIIIKNALNSIVKLFKEEPLVYFNSFGHTQKHSIKLGWKFELMNKLSGNKSAIINLTDEQKIDIYSGKNLPSEKKDCKVNGVLIPNSGVANYILQKDENNLTQEECLKQLIPIKVFCKSQKIYFACKALNYRYDANKWDGSRPLAVFLDWFINDEGKLDVAFDFEHPLERNGNEAADKLIEVLKEMRLSSFDELKDKLAANINIYHKDNEQI